MTGPEKTLRFSLSSLLWATGLGIALSSMGCELFGSAKETIRTDAGDPTAVGGSAADPAGAAMADPSGPACDTAAVMPNEELNALLVRGNGNYGAKATEVMTAYFTASNAFYACDYGYARTVLNNLWKKYPAKDPAWGGLVAASTAFSGDPVAYYGLQMLEFALEAQETIAPPASPKKAFLTVLAIDCVQGKSPQNLVQFNNGTGPLAQRRLDPRLLADDAAVLRQSLYLFNTYVNAITKRKLTYEVRVVRPQGICPNFILDNRFALIDSTPVFGSVPQEIIDTTDFWLLAYPSALPTAVPELKSREFITGVTTKTANGSPLLMVNDTWFLETAPHHGTGTFSRLQRQTYLPQWFQHEFFHHLFSIYPEFKLETASGHDWFNRSFWPSDFVGFYEPDYYDEAVRKRLYNAQPALEDRLLYAPVR